MSNQANTLEHDQQPVNMDVENAQIDELEAFKLKMENKRCVFIIKTYLFVFRLKQVQKIQQEESTMQIVAKTPEFKRKKFVLQQAAKSKKYKLNNSRNNRLIKGNNSSQIIPDMRLESHV